MSMDRLTTNELTLISYIEQKWHQDGKFPNPEIIENKFDVDIRDLILNKAVFKKALDNRGIRYPNYALGDIDLEDLSNEQVSAVITILNLEDKRTRAAKLKDLGLTVQQWNGWMKDPKFVEFLQETSAKNFHAALDKAHEGLTRSIERGDVNGIKLYMELTGRHNTATPTMQNVQVLLQRVVEVIQKHVKDPQLLRAIGEDFERVMNGQPVEQRKQIEV